MDAVDRIFLPRTRDLQISDILDCLRLGWRDFRRAPAIGIAVSALFSIVGIIIFAQLFVWGERYWVIPIAAGFPLIGPFAAVGIYEVSRRLEAGQSADWATTIQAIKTEKSRQIPLIAAMAAFFYLVWVYLAHLIFALTFGLAPITNVMSSPEFLLSTNGIIMLVLGTIVGGGLAVILFSITVISVPMLMHREIDMVTAMIVSVRSVLQNPRPMLLWGLIVGVLTALAIVPLFLGMLIVFPVLGHATWHLYRRAVEPDSSQ